MYAGLIQKAIALGAKEAKLIDTNTIKVAAWVRIKCQYGCPHYNTSFCCPPYTPTHDQTKAIISAYQKGLLIHGLVGRDITKIIVELEKEAFLSGLYKAFGLGAGPCTLCEECGDECRFPNKARPSMEACGIDVYTTARKNNYPVQVLTDRAARGDYFGLLLLA